MGIPVPIDSIAEVRVTTSNFGPQYGRASGGVVNVVTASWHQSDSWVAYTEFNPPCSVYSQQCDGCSEWGT